jgi:hypothetical protein
MPEEVRNNMNRFACYCGKGEAMVGLVKKRRSVNK